MYKQTVTPTR